MARQKGLIKIEGTLGDISFYRTADGFMAREKGGVSADRIKNDPAFKRTLENGQEFGRAGKASKTLRTALRELLLLASDPRVTSRLTKEMMRILKTDAISARGLRQVTLGDLSLLKGFEFNVNGQLSTTLFASYNTVIDRAGGTLTVTVPPFAPGTMIKAPAGATHFRLISGGAEVSFETGNFLTNLASTLPLPINNADTASLTLESLVTPNTREPLFLAFGIEFYQQVNGQFYSLNNGAFNGLALVQVNQAA